MLIAPVLTSAPATKSRFPWPSASFARSSFCRRVSWIPNRQAVPSAARENPKSEMRLVLAHELAHIRHHDLHWLAVSRTLMLVLWCQPFFWFLRRRIRLDQESLADAAAADLSTREHYAEQLVSWAKSSATTAQAASPPASDSGKAPRSFANASPCCWMTALSSFDTSRANCSLPSSLFAGSPPPRSP